MSAAQRHAPALRVEVHTQPALQLAVVFLALLAQGLVLAALTQHGYMPAGLAWWCLLLLLLALSAAWAWQAARVRPRLLIWDGQCWYLHERAADGTALDPALALRLRVVFDFDSCLLLRAWVQDPAAPWLHRCRHAMLPLYLPLSRWRQPALWPALRATLFAVRHTD